MSQRKKKIRWRVIEEAIAGAWPPLVSAHTCTCMHQPEHTQTCIHACSTDTQRDGRRGFRKHLLYCSWREGLLVKGKELSICQRRRPCQCFPVSRSFSSWPASHPARLCRPAYVAHYLSPSPLSPLHPGVGGGSIFNLHCNARAEQDSLPPSTANRASWKDNPLPVPAESFPFTLI